MTLSALASLLSAVLVLACASHSWAEAHDAPTAALSPELRTAFIAEMQHLDTALQRAVSALARAEWSLLEHTAHEIKGSFILQQRLSSEQLSELHRVLPEAFIALDRDFHARAERLADAAKGADAELSAFYVYKLSEACVSCHAQYAPQRFPGLSTSEAPHHH